ncbi:MAG: sugar phosphate isomerase/epimerase [Acidobacteria bacterium]|nr:sugar phosphate isomerase/epimerase [Acidobacteriota bacterium]
MTRRTFASSTALASSAALALAVPGNRKMTIHLSAGAIGVKADTRMALEYAARFGFESIDADPVFLGGLSQGALNDILGQMKSKGVGWGLSGLRVEFRKGDGEFAAGMKDLPAHAAALQRAGVKRVTTWLSPASDTLTYLENFRIHARRLREVARVLNDNGCRFGMEYVGPKTLWAARRYPFIHSMREMKELIGEIGFSSVGFVLDSWHWYTARESAADLRTLSNRDVVSVDLNDAPAGLDVDQQIDSRRELPVATGVIDVKAFLTALRDMGCDAPVRAEPFNAALRQMPPEQALAATVQAMKKAFAFLGG